jgi:hypothetical protein
MGRRRFGGMNEMGIFFRGWRIWKDGDLDLPARSTSLNIEQVSRTFEREREKEMGIEEGR